MRVKLLTTITGTRDGVDWPARGAVVDLPEAEAVSMLNAGMVATVEPVIEDASTAKRGK